MQVSIATLIDCLLQFFIKKVRGISKIDQRSAVELLYRSAAAHLTNWFPLLFFLVNPQEEIEEDEERMEWLSLSGGVPCLSLVCLGTSYRDKYYISHDCLCKYITFTVANHL